MSHKGIKRKTTDYTKRVPGVKKLGYSEVLRARKKASSELIDLIFRPEKQGTKTAVALAGGVIEICARNGVSIAWVKENFLRRFSDQKTIAAIERQMDFLLCGRTIKPAKPKR